MTGKFTENMVEQATLAWFEALEYQVLYGPDIGPGEPNPLVFLYAKVGPEQADI